MPRSKTALLPTLVLTILLMSGVPVSAQEGVAEGTLGASSGQVPPPSTSTSSDAPFVTEEGFVHQDGDVFAGCDSDYRALGPEDARACYEAGFTPRNYPEAEQAAPPAVLPDTGGAAPVLLGAGALMVTAGFLMRRAWV